MRHEIIDMELPRYQDYQVVREPDEIWLDDQIRTIKAKSKYSFIGRWEGYFMWFMIGLLVAVLSGSLGIYIGTQCVRQEAADNGVGVWICDKKTGNVRFEFLTRFPR